MILVDSEEQNNKKSLSETGLASSSEAVNSVLSDCEEDLSKVNTRAEIDLIQICARVPACYAALELELKSELGLLLSFHSVS